MNKKGPSGWQGMGARTALIAGIAFTALIIAAVKKGWIERGEAALGGAGLFAIVLLFAFAGGRR